MPALQSMRVSHGQGQRRQVPAQTSSCLQAGKARRVTAKGCSLYLGKRFASGQWGATLSCMGRQISDAPKGVLPSSLVICRIHALLRELPTLQSILCAC